MAGIVLFRNIFKKRPGFLVRAIISKVCISKTSRKINLCFERDEKFYALSLVRHSAQMRTILNMSFSLGLTFILIFGITLFSSEIS